MKFGPVSLAQAEGAILAHSVALPAGRLRKGRALTRADLDALAQAGLDMVTVAQLEPDDSHEDAAALALAQALVPAPEAAGLSLRPVGTGRVNIVATGPGLVQVGAAQIHAANAVAPTITVATLPDLQRVEAGAMVATVKIIAYGVASRAIADACAQAHAALHLRAPVLRHASLIQTRVSPTDTGAKGHAVTEARLARLGVSLAPPCMVDHALAPLTGALRAARAELILILTGSATSDLHDTAPEALRRSGGQVLHFGMPVDPGNLLFLGALEGRPVVGLPGCAKSPALNGADWVLERLICGLDVTPPDIMSWGVGGLLSEIDSRPRPRRMGETAQGPAEKGTGTRINTRSGGTG